MNELQNNNITKKKQKHKNLIYEKDKDIKIKNHITIIEDKRSRLCAWEKRKERRGQKRGLQLDKTNTHLRGGNIDVFQLRRHFEGGDASKSKI